MKNPERSPLEMSVARLLSANPLAVPVFLRHHMACVGCSMSAFDSLADALAIYGIQVDLFLQELQQAVLAKGGAETTSFTNIEPKE